MGVCSVCQTEALVRQGTFLSSKQGFGYEREILLERHHAAGVFGKECFPGPCEHFKCEGQDQEAEAIVPQNWGPVDPLQEEFQEELDRDLAWDLAWDPEWSLVPAIHSACPVNEGEVYYCPGNNQVFQLRIEVGGGWTCGGFTDFYNDSRTRIFTEFQSTEFLDKCIPVGDVSVFPHAVEVDLIGWKVKD